jgi:hypothetical protein
MNTIGGGTSVSFSGSSVPGFGVQDSRDGRCVGAVSGAGEGEGVPDPGGCLR